MNEHQHCKTIVDIHTGHLAPNKQQCALQRWEHQIQAMKYQCVRSVSDRYIKQTIESKPPYVLESNGSVF